LHQSDGFSNLKAFQALELSADGTGKATGGGWEPTQGFGSLDVQQLARISSNSNPRHATVGDVTGVVYSSGTPKANAMVYAREVASPNRTYRTLTFADGSYRFTPFPGGIYDVSAAIQGVIKTKRVQVTNGCDTPGTDFFIGPVVADKTPPVIERFNLTNQTKTTLDFDQWAIDPESEIDSATVQIGSTSGAANLSPAQVIVPGNTKVHLSGLRLPNNYFVTFSYTNGAGLVSKAVRAVQPSSATAFVTDSSGSKSKDSSKVEVKSGSAGSNEIAYVQIDISCLRGNVTNVQIDLTGSSKGEPVAVGAFATNNITWTEGSLDWENAPTLQGAAVDQQSVASLKSYSWNVTQIVQSAKLAGTKSITIAFKCLANSTSGAQFSSATASSGAPVVNSISND
jgi:hypothetical protein